MPKRPQKAATPHISEHPDVRSDVATESAPEIEQEVQKTAGLSAKWRDAYVIVPALIAFATAANSLGNYFVSDDLEQVLNNPFIKRLGNLPSAFTSSISAFTSTDIILNLDPYFRPIFSALSTINYALFGIQPWGWHLVNIIIHSAATVLVFLVTRELTERNWVSALTAVLFAVHPAHAESVAWVSGVTDPLMALLLLPAFFFYLRFRKRGRKSLFAASLIFFFLALLAKETAVAFPFAVFACELFYFDREREVRPKLMAALRLSAWFIVPVAIYFLMRYHALSVLVFGGQPRYPLLPSLLTIPFATVKYLSLLLLPWGYSYQHYTSFVETVFSLNFVVPVIIIAAIVVGAVLSKSKELIVALLWFIVMLGPALVALRQFEPAYLLQERFLYVPSIGICLAIALGINWIAEHSMFGLKGRSVSIAFAALVTIVWSIELIRLNAVWDDTVSVYRHAVAVSPQSSAAHAMLSRSLYDEGRPLLAEAESQIALNLDPQCATAYMNMSYFARMSGKLETSNEYLERAFSAIPVTTWTRHDLATMYLNAGLLFGQRKMADAGEENLLKSTEISPRPVAWYYLGQFYFDQGRYDEARTMFELTASRLPRWFAPIHVKLGLTYEALKDVPRALAEYETYLELAPADATDRDGVKRHINDLRVAPPKTTS